MSIVVGTLITMGLQIGVSIYNQKYNRENLAEINKWKQDFKASTQNNSLARDYEKFRRSCDLQLKIEEESHVERLRIIDEKFINSFAQTAHEESLQSHYPLRISPYIISKSVIPICGTQINHSRQEVFCILTNSNDVTFNKQVLPDLDDLICYAISSFWNQRSLHTICYYPNVWKEQSVFCNEDINNIKSLIVTPTITITPFFEKNKDESSLIIKLNLWGIGNDLEREIGTSIIFKTNPKNYSNSEKETIISQLFPLILCAMGQVIDMYYWANYYQPPILPSLIERGHIPCDNETINEFGTVYAELYEDLALGINMGNYPVALKDQVFLNNIADCNQCNFPQRSIGFLGSVISLTKAGTESSKLIQSTTTSFYKARTGNNVKSLSEIDVSCLDSSDMDIISELAVIAKTSSNVSVFQELRDVISRKILLW